MDPRVLPLAVICLLLFTVNECSASFYDLAAVNIDGRMISMSRFRGSVSLVINVASFCGLTERNYVELVEMQKKYQDLGFQVLAFPCNQFKEQEPKSNSEVKAFAAKYGATFPLFAKTTVNPGYCSGTFDTNECSAASSGCCSLNSNVYRHLKAATSNDDVQWNFEKFLVGRDGKVRKRSAPTVDPSSLSSDVEALLGEVAPYL